MKLNENDRIGGKRSTKNNGWSLKAFALFTLVSTASAGLFIALSNPNTVFSGPLTPLNKYVVKKDEVVHVPSFLPLEEPEPYIPPSRTISHAATQELLNSVHASSIQEEQPKPEQKQEKQTVFNDDNYQPRGAINTVSMHTPQRSQYSRLEQTQSGNKKVTTTNKHSVYWHWPSVQKDRRGESGYFYYTEVNGKIDTRPICSNFKQGSLVYRDCRKAAKKHFQKKCSPHNRAACTASNMAP